MGGDRRWNSNKHIATLGIEQVDTIVEPTNPDNMVVPAADKQQIPGYLDSIVLLLYHILTTNPN